MLGVLLVHLALLAGELPEWRAVPEKHAAASPPSETSQITSDPSQGVPEKRVKAVAVGTLRWIEAPQAPPPPVAQPAVKRVAKPPRAQTPPPAPPVEAVAAGEVQRAEPDDATRPERPATDTTVVAEDVSAPAPEVTAAAVPDPERAAPLAQTAEPVTSPSTPPPTAEATFESASEPMPEDALLALATKPAPGKPRGNSANAPARSAPLPPAKAPAPARLGYDVSGQIKGIHYSASAQLDWRPSGSRYDAQMEVRVFLLGKRTQTSSGLLDASGLHPERFADRSRSEKAAHFEYAQERIRFSSNAPDVRLQAGAQDRLSVFLQLAALFNARPDAFATGQKILLQVAGTGDAEVWQFDVGPLDELSLPVGPLRAWRLSRSPRSAYDSGVDIWLAPALNHLPVRIRITQQNGDVADQQLNQMP